MVSAVVTAALQRPSLLTWAPLGLLPSRLPKFREAGSQSRGCHHALQNCRQGQSSHDLCELRSCPWIVSLYLSTHSERKCESVSRSVVSNSLQPHGLQPNKLLCLWDSLGKSTGVSSHSLLQGIFPTQGLNPGLLHCRQFLYQLSHLSSKCLLNE